MKDKQIEEAARRYADNLDNEIDFKAGAKWHREQMKAKIEEAEQVKLDVKQLIKEYEIDLPYSQGSARVLIDRIITDLKQLLK